MNKKAITPLLSTLLLLVFAASLGAIVISWGESQNGLAVYPITCQTVELQLVELERAEQICYEDGRLEFIIQNLGEAPLLSIKVTVMGEDKFYSEVIETELYPADILRKSIYYDSAIGDIQKVFIVPKIKENNIVKFCPRNGIEIEYINQC